MPADRDGASRARLAIAIPAFGRAETIANSIAEMAKEARSDRLDVIFYVSDDTPDTSVEDLLRPLIGTNPSIHYRRNTPSLGHDHNLIATLSWPDADYVWLLGSGYRVAPGKIGRVLHFLKDQDLVFVNSHSDRDAIITSSQHREARILLKDMLWHQTLTGVTIYGKVVCDWIRASDKEIIIAPDFPQISVMMGYVSKYDATIGWLGEKVIQSAGSKSSSYWSSRAIDVFVDHWAAAVAAFPTIVPPNQRSHVIKEHSRRTNLFNTTNLINLRRSGQFNWNSMRQQHFRDAMHLPSWKLFAILALPIPVLQAGGTTLARLKRLGACKA